MANNLYIALGSNWHRSPRMLRLTLEQSLRLFSRESLKIKTSSGWYRSPAFPAGAGPDFLNGVVAVETDQSAEDALSALHRIEAELGRERKTRWGARTCDLDLLAYSDIVSPDLPTLRNWIDLPLDRQMKETPAELILPHPRLQDRAFVLLPWSEIAPDWRHPVMGQSIAEMLAKLPENAVSDVQKVIDGDTVMAAI